MAMALRAGVPLGHGVLPVPPTGVAARACSSPRLSWRGFGFLLNRTASASWSATRRMRRTSPAATWSSRAIATEVREGRGAGPTSDYVCSSSATSARTSSPKRLPASARLQDLPAHRPGGEADSRGPTAHYVMGGNPTTASAAWLRRAARAPRRSRRASTPPASAPASPVHGANRLGGNSLLDILVFGARRRPGHHRVPEGEPAPPADETRPAWRRRWSGFERWDRKGDGRRVKDVARELTKAMEDHCGVYRTEAVMPRASSA